MCRAQAAGCDYTPKYTAAAMSAVCAPAHCRHIKLSAWVNRFALPRRNAAEKVRVLTLRQKLLDGLQGMEEIYINGDLEHRVPHNLNISFNFVEGESLIMAIKDVAVSSGSACTSASLEPSYVLRALDATMNWRTPLSLYHRSLYHRRRNRFLNQTATRKNRQTAGVIAPVGNAQRRRRPQHGGMGDSLIKL